MGNPDINSDRLYTVCRRCNKSNRKSHSKRCRRYNYNSFKNKSHYFGLTIGYNSSSFKIEHSRRFIGNQTYRWNEGVSNPGLTLSMITNFKIGEHFYDQYGLRSKRLTASYIETAEKSGVSATAETARWLHGRCSLTVWCSFPPAIYAPTCSRFAPTDAAM